MIFKSLFIKGTCMSMPSMNAIREAEDFVVAISSQVQCSSNGESNSPVVIDWRRDTCTCIKEQYT